MLPDSAMLTSISENDISMECRVKLLRVKTIEDNKGETLVSEGVDANYQDMINYAVFALIHLKEQHEDISSIK